MLGEFRSAVCKMWDVAEGLEEAGVGKLIPFIPKGSDIRHTMKMELLVSMFDISGADSIPNDEQLAFLQYVIHAPIKEERKEEYVKIILGYKKIMNNPLLPCLILLDRRFDSEIAEVYLSFFATIVGGYIKLADSVDVGMLLRYVTFMMNNKRLIEKGYGREIEFDPFELFKEKNGEILRNIYKYQERIDEKDSSFAKITEALEYAIDTDKGNSDNEIYKDFNENLTEDNRVKSTSEDDGTDASTEQIKTTEEIKEELESLIGLWEVKKQVQSMFNLVKIRQECKNRNIKRQPMSYHMVFSGNPGTGKTTVARLIAEVYHNMGLLSKGHLVEVSRADLVAGYVGQTAPKVQEVLKKAKGGVLFIDEAYSLTSHGDNDFGNEAIETLIKGMEDNRDDLVVIVAGYPALMNDFMSSNPGLSSRFPKTIYFSDYNADELTQIFKKFCKDNSVRANKNVLEVVHKYFESQVAHKPKNFGNARMVRNYFEQTMINQADRLAEKDEITDRMLRCITVDDVPKKIIIDKMTFFKV